MLPSHRGEGVETVSTSISSHNVPVFNLCVSLGFLIPAALDHLAVLVPGRQQYRRENARWQCLARISHRAVRRAEVNW